MKSAVEWYYNAVNDIVIARINNKIDDELLIQNLLNAKFQAKEMEKNNLYECGSFWRGKENKIEKPFFEQWYNETYKSE
jgi:hypothetical protein